MVSITNPDQYCKLNDMVRELGFNYIIPLFKITGKKNCGSNFPEICKPETRKIASISSNFKMFDYEIDQELNRLSLFLNKNKARYGYNFLFNLF